MTAKTSIREGLAAATCALIGLNAPAPVDATELETSVLVYTEPGGRLNVFESATRFRRSLDGEKILTTRLTVDIMTGASPNGATPSAQPQTFTRPSGKGSYVVRPGETPLDDTFQDNRVGIGVDLELPLGRLTRLSFGGQGSVEYDYISSGGNAAITHDFNKRNTQITLALSASQDDLHPEGAPPVPFASMQPAQTQPIRQGGTKDKTVFDGVIGINHIVSRRAIIRVNYALNRTTGYLTDPFKLISVIDGTTGANQGEALDYVFENRPDSRTKHSIYTAAKYHLSRDVVDVSYRYMQDDWEIRSHTAELRYRWDYAPRQHLQPQFRYYHQSAADFYVHSLVDAAPTPRFASADYRLGKFDAFTFALKYGIQRNNGQFINLRFGYYVQLGDRSPPDAIGAQRGLDLFPTVHALTGQVSYGFDW